MPSGILSKTNQYLGLGFFATVAVLLSVKAETKADLLVRVAPSGGGAESNVVRSLEDARNRIRLWRAAGGTGGVTVRVDSGEYYLPETFELEPEDSGTAAGPVLYEAAGLVRLIGGTKLTLPASWEKGEELVISVSAPFVDPSLDARLSSNRPKFDVIWKEKCLSLARWPDASTPDKAEDGWAHLEAAPGDNVRDSFICRTLPSRLTENLDDAEVHVFSQPEWWDEVIEISGYDDESGQIRLVRPANYPLEAGARFYLQNVRAALDSPGEWWFDAAESKIHLIAPEAGTSSTEVYISRIPTLLKLHGVMHIAFRGFSWEGSTGDAIVLDDVAECEFTGNRVRLTGGWGVTAKTDKRLTLDGNMIANTGLGGVKLSGGDRYSLTPAQIIASDNTLTDLGRSVLCYMPAFQLEGVGITVVHNRISHLPHNAIMYSGNNHWIKSNVIEDVCRETSDVGAIYSGRDWGFRGTVIEGNVFRDIAGMHLRKRAEADAGRPSARLGAHAIYLDDLIENTTIRHNVFENIKSAAIHFGGGSYHTVTGNYFVRVQRGLFISFRNTFQIQLERSRVFLAAGSPYFAAYPELTDRAVHAPLVPSHIRWENNYFFEVAMPYDIELLGPENTFAQNHFSVAAPEVSVLLEKSTSKESIKTWAAWQTAGFDADAKLDVSLTSQEKRAIDKIIAEAGPRKREGVDPR